MPLFTGLHKKGVFIEMKHAERTWMASFSQDLWDFFHLKTPLKVGEKLPPIQTLPLQSCHVERHLATRNAV